MSELPVDEVLPQVLASLSNHPCLVLEAPTGSGKTTRVPPALLDAGLGPVLVLEPRRLAARAAARWIATERGGVLGDEVGYQVRFDRKSSPATRLLVVTEGVLLRFLQDDPFLDGYGTIVLDEFHERSLEADLALALVRQVQREAREDLKLIVMSATLEGDAVARALGGAPVVRGEGRAFPVDVQYVPEERGEDARDHLVRGVRAALAAVEGDVLVFLPGVGEIRRAAESLAGVARKHALELHELYGDLPPEKQDAVLRRGARRKLVLATNVAESSVTVDGVAAVVDVGLARVMRHDPGAGLDRLELGPISIASSDQRAGRAGRQGPGVCVRLWSAHDQKSRPLAEVPAIHRLDLTGPVLELACFGERDPAQFAWFEPPKPEALSRATHLLGQLGAIEDGAPTKLGRKLARFPAHPRLARLLVEGDRLGVARRACLAAALLSERDPFERAQFREPRARVTDSDVLDRVEALEAFVRSGTLDAGPRRLQRGGARFVARAADQFERLLRPSGKTVAEDPDEALLRALLAAFPDRLCRRRAEGDERGLMVGGRGVVLGKESGVTEAPFFLAVDLDGAGKDARVRQASTVQRAWLGEPEEVVCAVFDPERERVVGRKELRLRGLVLESHDQAEVDAGEVEALLLEAALLEPARATGFDREELADFAARVSWLRAARPDLGLPDPAPAAILPHLVPGCRSFADLRRAPVLHALKGLYDYAQLQTIDREAPERMAVPSGSNLRLAYEPGAAPVLAVKLQELFGLQATPTVAGGRVKVLLHLLAPNGRPQQVTDDLASFWANTYEQVRKDLRGRYPKHPWPEDPTQAVAQRGLKRRR